MRVSVPHRQHMGGFTLMEVLLALFIFVIVMVVITSGFGLAVRAERQVAEVSEHLSEVQIAEAMLTRDFSQMVSRSVLDVDGSVLPALYVRVDGAPYHIEFTRSSVINPMQRSPRSSLLRVAYEWDGELLIRKTWRVLDRAPTSLADSRVLLRGVQNFQVSYLNNDGEFEDLTEEQKQVPHGVLVTLNVGQKQLSRMIYIARPSL